MRAEEEVTWALSPKPGVPQQGHPRAHSVHPSHRERSASTVGRDLTLTPLCVYLDLLSLSPVPPPTDARDAHRPGSLCNSATAQRPSQRTTYKPQVSGLMNGSWPAEVSAAVPAGRQHPCVSGCADTVSALSTASGSPQGSASPSCPQRAPPPPPRREAVAPVTR